MGYAVFDLNYLRKRTVSLHCGQCRVKLPAAGKVLFALVTRSRIINVIDEPLSKLLAEFDSDDKELSDSLEETPAQISNLLPRHVVPAKDSLARVFRVVRDPKPIKEDDVRAQIKAQHPNLSQEELETEVNEEIGPVYSTMSERKGRLGAVEVVDDEDGHCKVECYSCGFEFVIDRVKAGHVAAHVARFKGVCFVDELGFTVDGGAKLYRSPSHNAAD